jgi:hypothetical protein
MYRDNVWDWWQARRGPRGSPGRPGRRDPHPLARGRPGRPVPRGGGRAPWRVINIPAQADHDPAKGETTRWAGAGRVHAVDARRRTPAQWEPSRIRLAPAPSTPCTRADRRRLRATLFKRGLVAPLRHAAVAITRDDGSRWLTGYDDELISWDMAFKDTEGSDFVSARCGCVAAPTSTSSTRSTAGWTSFT